MDTVTQNKFNKAAIDLAAINLKRNADKAALSPARSYTYGQSSVSPANQAASALNSLSASAAQTRMASATRATQALSVVSASNTRASQRIELETVDDECVEIRVGGRTVATLVINE